MKCFNPINVFPLLILLIVLEIATAEQPHQQHQPTGGVQHTCFISCVLSIISPPSIWSPHFLRLPHKQKIICQQQVSSFLGNLFARFLHETDDNQDSQKHSRHRQTNYDTQVKTIRRRVIVVVLTVVVVGALPILVVLLSNSQDHPTVRYIHNYDKIRIK